MPKRTNPFQTLIAFIERELAGSGVKVTESAMLSEGGSNEREVDILIEAEINGHPVCIALECRDHKRPQDVTWIDCLIGKYIDLRVDRVVAVSSSGFSAGALEKANRHRIRTLTLEQALEHNWPEEFERVIAKFVSQTLISLSANLKFGNGPHPLSTSEGLESCEIMASDGTSDGTLNEVANYLFKELTLKIRIRISFLDARQSDYFYNKTQVVLASVDDPGSDNELSVAIVQFPPSFSDRFKLAYKLITPKQSG